MPIDRKFLVEGEEVVVEVRPHWSVVVRPVFGAVLVAAAAVAVDIGLGPLPTWGLAVLLAVAILPILRGVVALSRWWRSLTFLTSERLLFRNGVVRTTLVQVHLGRVADVQCSQSILDRSLGRGVLTIELFGDEPVVLYDVRRPRAFQQVLTNELRALRGEPLALEGAAESAWDAGSNEERERVDVARPARAAERRRASRARRGTLPEVFDHEAEMDPVPDAVPPKIGERLQELLEEFRNDEITAAEYEASRHEVLSRWRIDREGSG